jgi:diguanylate cyclase (GGDEF)-like protein
VEKPATPLDEQARLDALRALGILDTPPEERFDRLTRIARQLFDVPIALVSLIDADRQWFKSADGLDATETPRDISFCGHAILGDDVFIIPDATQDPRFADNPLVTGEPHIRFYAGCPIKHVDGSKLGTLCIIDTRPRILEMGELTAMRDLAALVERELAMLQLATQDELTGLYNRRAFLMLGQQSLNFCAREEMSASLIFLDLDDLKGINDQYGHEAGDQAIAKLADEIRNTCRDMDVAARLGGDEFVLLLLKAKRATARRILKRLCDALDAFNDSSGLPYDVTCSLGVVEFDRERHKTIEGLLVEGDELMYENKASKRAEDGDSSSEATA